MNYVVANWQFCRNSQTRNADVSVTLLYRDHLKNESKSRRKNPVLMAEDCLILRWPCNYLQKVVFMLGD